LHNRGNYLISLGKLCAWLAEHAEGLGVDIFTKAAVDELLFDQQGAVVGVATKDMGINKKGEKKPGFERGI
jgi:electron-transferring-flavoprotein dehydrogenase